MRRLPTSGGELTTGGESGTGSWLAGLVPDSAALRALAVEVRGPETVTVGEPARFDVTVRNRLPATVSVTLPTPRVWGWLVDGAPEADERGYEPPETTRTVTFGRRERREFATAWDGQIRRADGDGNVWVARTGKYRFTGYFAAEAWERRGLYDRHEVRVVEGSSVR